MRHEKSIFRIVIERSHTVMTGMLAVFFPMISILAFDASDLPKPFAYFAQPAAITVSFAVFILSVVLFIKNQALSPVRWWGIKFKNYKRLRAVDLHNIVAVVGSTQTGKSTLISNLFFDTTIQARTPVPQAIVWAANRNEKQFHLGFIDIPETSMFGDKKIQNLAPTLLLLIDNTADNLSEKIDTGRRDDHRHFINSISTAMGERTSGFQKTLVIFTKWDLWGYNDESSTTPRAKAAKRYINDIIGFINQPKYRSAFGNEIEWVFHSNTDDFLVSTNRIVDFVIREE